VGRSGEPPVSHRQTTVPPIMCNFAAARHRRNDADGPSFGPGIGQCLAEGTGNSMQLHRCIVACAQGAQGGFKCEELPAARARLAPRIVQPRYTCVEWAMEPIYVIAKDPCRRPAGVGELAGLARPCLGIDGPREWDAMALGQWCLFFSVLILFSRMRFALDSNGGTNTLQDAYALSSAVPHGYLSAAAAPAVIIGGEGCSQAQAQGRLFSALVGALIPSSTAIFPQAKKTR
jgi:hypothetical protein